MPVLGRRVVRQVATSCSYVKYGSYLYVRFVARETATSYVYELPNDLDGFNDPSWSLRVDLVGGKGHEAHGTSITGTTDVKCAGVSR